MQKGEFSSSSKGNQQEKCKVVTLRSGRPLASSSAKAKIERLNVEREKTKKETNEEEKEKDVPTLANLGKYFDPTPVISFNISYPQRFKQKNLEALVSKFLEIFKKLHINIPFVEALEQMSNYVKFMKDVLSRKKMFEKYENVSLIEECSAILLKKLP